MISTLVKTSASSSKLQPCGVLVASSASAAARTGTRQSTSRVVRCRLLTTKTPQQPQSTPPPTSSNSSSTPQNRSSFKTNNPASQEMSNPPDVTLEVTPEMRMSNMALATVLIGFVSGVWYYSMMKVGSQDSSDGNDPLAQLKMEAQEALDRQEREHSPDQRAQQLLQEFNRGEHDPDKAELEALEELERMEEEDAKKKTKKSWWKFW